MESSQLFPTVCLRLQCAAINNFQRFKNLAPLFEIAMCSRYNFQLFQEPCLTIFTRIFFSAFFQVDRKEGRWAGPT